MTSGFDPRCPWHQRCSCTHTLCVKGWLDGDDESRRCPVCDAARRQLPYIRPVDHAMAAANDDWRLDQ